MSREAMKLALEALETKGEHHPRVYQAITALREALAEQQGWKLVPVIPTQEMLDAPPNAWPADAIITWNAMLAAAPQPAQQEFVSPGGGYVPTIPAQQRPIKTFHGGKAWPIQEPAQRTWVGLTDGERKDLLKTNNELFYDELDYAEAIETKLKEKNNG